MGLGESIKRLDATEKVTGRARYTEDLIPRNALHVKVVHSTIANGRVKTVKTKKAQEMPGVEMVLTCFDVPQTLYGTSGHPLSLDPLHGDVKDKLILTSRIRYYGDDVAAVVADTPLHAQLAAEQVEVVYEEFSPLLEPEDAVGNVCTLHKGCPTNELARLDFTIDADGNTVFGTSTFSSNEKIAEQEDLVGDHYYVSTVHACHMENNGCFAYMEGRKVVVVSCNQMPHTLRRNIAEAIGVPLGDVRVIKPYLGGGFGNKQDTMYETLVAFLTKSLGGRPVSLQLTREETFVNTRVRHAFDMNMFTEVNDEGTIQRKALRINSNGGAYAAHGHAVTAYAITNNFQTYVTAGMQRGESSTAYTTRPSAGAMRGYGIPQLGFAMESQMDDIALKHGWDPVDFRLKNVMPLGFVDPFDKFVVRSNGVKECIERGRKISLWDTKRKKYDAFNKTSHDIKHGIGMALFSYKTGVYPLQIENGSCRIQMNEDGSAVIQVGATELGQGSDTVLCQMVSEITTIPEERLSIVSTQDTDTTPYDGGAYASRQAYVSGGAAKKAAELLCNKLIHHAGTITGRATDGWSVFEQSIVDAENNVVLSFKDLCRHMNFVNDLKTMTEHITVEATFTASAICFSYGVSYVDLTVDVPLGKVKINKIYAVHDSGRILNPTLAAAQLHGGIAMGVGYALGEQLMFDRTTGRPLNNNLLDYKVPTSMDIPEIEIAFVETYEPSGPFGNKGLGEPPVIAQAPAIRNAILHATGVGMYKLPMNPQYLVESFTRAGLLG